MNNLAAAPDSSSIVVTEGRSMFPLIRPGSRVRLRRVQPDAVAPGNIIAFREGDRVVVHRLIEKRMRDGRLFLREKGDNNAVSTWIEENQLTGQAVSLERQGVVRNLDIPPGRCRLHLLTQAMRTEALVFERLLQVKKRLLGDRNTMFTRGAARLLRAALFPLKLVIGPILLSVYGRQERQQEGEESQIMWLLFRSLCENKPFQVSSLSAPASWENIATAADLHGILSHLLPVWTDLAGRGILPAEHLEEARRRRYRDAMSHLAAMATLKDVHQVLSRHGIPYAVIKGPALSLQLYDGGTLRGYGDVDVVVRRPDRERAIRALTEQHFDAAGTRLNQRLVRLGHFHIVLEPRAKSRLKVELHWSLVDRANLYRVDEDEVFSRLRKLGQGKDEFFALAPEDELIYLCMHLAKHAVLNEFGWTNQEPPEWFCRTDTGNRLLWFLDVYLFLRKYGEQLNWNAVLDRARRWNTYEDVIQCLCILNALLPDSSAASALKKLGWSGAERTATAPSILGRLFKTSWGRRVIERSMVLNPEFTLRPVRFLFMGRLMFPAPRKLLRYYGTGNPLTLPILYLVHPFLILRKQIS